MRFLHYNPAVVAAPENNPLPGIALFSKYFQIYNPAVVPVDRTGTLKLPVKTKSLFPLPKLVPEKENYEDICNARARELLARAERLHVPLIAFWSGGIDSTLALISFLKNATPEQKKNIIVCMSEESIEEYPLFYREHIAGKLKTESSNMFTYLLGGRYLIVNGECNDQVFGSDAIGVLIQRFGNAVIHKPYDRQTFFEFFNASVQDKLQTEKYLALFEKLAKAAPVAIERNYDFLWWINFSLKWQNVYMRTLSYVAKRNVAKITPEYVREHYAPFYCTDAFQLWSMLNPDKKIKDTWQTYKWEAKQVIYGFTRDAEYRDNKVKRGSLYNLITQQRVWNFIDDEFGFHETRNASQYYEPDNDFR